jgi:hypothetical protein
MGPEADFSCLVILRGNRNIFREDAPSKKRVRLCNRMKRRYSISNSVTAVAKEMLLGLCDAGTHQNKECCWQPPIKQDRRDDAGGSRFFYAMFYGRKGRIL